MQQEDKPIQLQAKGGEARWFKLDFQTIHLLEEMPETFLEKLQVKPSTAVITRRALRFYADHLSKLLNKKDQEREELFRAAGRSPVGRIRRG